MRPVNLIPLEERRGGSAPTRTGPIVYFIVGGLAVVLLAVCAVVLLGNQITDKETEVAALESRATETEARADSLSSYVSFEQMKDARVQTIDSLAKSRFDWERVIRELSVVIPKGIWLSNLTGTVSPEVQIDDAAGIGLRSAIPGPALELVGCARSQPDIARLIASMHDIDGITRVTAANGIKSTTTDAAESTKAADDTAATDTSGSCPRSAPSFQLVAAFDAVVVDASGAAPTSPPPATEQAVTAEQQGVADAQTKAQKAANLVPGG